VAQYHNAGVYLAGQNYAFNFPGSTFVPVVEFAAGATDQPVITEIGFTNYSKAAHIPVEVAFGIAPAQGVGGYYTPPSSGAYDGVSARSALSIFTAWQKPPTIPAKMLRRMIFQEQVQVTITTEKYPFRRGGIKLLRNTSLVFYAFISTTQNAAWGEFYVEWDE
jgi:hypothetical protein